MPALPQGKPGRLELALAQHFDLEGAVLGNEPVPLRNCLGCALKGRSKPRDTAEVFDHVTELIHAAERKSAYYFRQVDLLTDRRGRKYTYIDAR